MSSKLERVIECADIFLNTYPEAAIVCVADHDKILYSKGGLETRIKVGTPLEQMRGTVLYKALTNSASYREERGPELVGYPYISSASPIFEDDRLVGAITAVVKIEKLGILRSGAEELSATLEELSATTEQISQTSNEVAEKTQLLQQESEGMIRDIQMINSVVGFVQDIAEQSHLLGLNAAIEAARAGDAGRGFAVVANEIRKMAGQSKTSAKEIENELKRILSSIKKINGLIHQVAVSTEDQSVNLKEINVAYNRIAYTAEQLVTASEIKAN